MSSTRTGSRPFFLDEYLADQKRLIEDYLNRFLPSQDTPPTVIHQAMRYSVFAGGKRIRPILALASAEAVEGRLEQVIRFACALEMLHTYSIIHDDLPAMDDDDLRRGRPTCHRKFGEGIAILAGNGLMTRAFDVLSEEIGDDPERARTQLRVIREVCRSVGTREGVIAGQVVDLTTQGKPFTADDLEFIHSCKTGALIQASVSCPVMLCGGDDFALSRFREFGMKVGLAFQIVDDILDLTGTREEMGKAVGKDDQVQKATFPALFGLDKSRAKAELLVGEAIRSLDFLGSRGDTLVELANFVTIRRT
jgi:geranylgeranyl diphosphate synthase type II